MRRFAEDGRFYSLADSQQEHLRADLSRTLHTPLYLPQYHHYGNLGGRHDNAHVITTLPCFAPPLPPALPTTPSPLLPSRFSLTAPSSPDVLRKALATLCLSSRGTSKKRNASSLRVTFADEIHVEGKDPPAASSPVERSPSPKSLQQPPRSVLKTSTDNYRIFRDRADSLKDRPDSFDQIPEEDEWKCCTAGNEAYPGSAPGSPGSPHLRLSPMARPEEKEPRRVSDTEAVSCRKELFASEEVLRRGSTGSMQATESPESLGENCHGHVEGQAASAIPALREQQGLQNLGPEYNYATYPAAKTLSFPAVRDVSVVPKDQPPVHQHRHAPPVVPTPSEEMHADYLAYATFPPMNPSAYGWLKTLPRLLHEKHHHDSASVASWSEVRAEKGSSNGSLSHNSTQSCYTSGSSGGSWSFVTQGDHHHGSHSPGKAPSSLSEVDHASSAPADRDTANSHRSLPLPAVTDFMLHRYLGEVTRVFQSHPTQPASKQAAEQASTDHRGHRMHHPSEQAASHNPGPHHPSPEQPPVQPFVPLPSSVLPPDMREKSVSFAPLGRYLIDLLHSTDVANNNSPYNYHGNHTPSAYFSKFRDCTSFSTLEGSWRALTDMVRFQSQFYSHPHFHLHPHDARHSDSHSHSHHHDARHSDTHSQHHDARHGDSHSHHHHPHGGRYNHPRSRSEPYDIQSSSSGYPASVGSSQLQNGDAAAVCSECTHTDCHGEQQRISPRPDRHRETVSQNDGSIRMAAHNNDPQRMSPRPDRQRETVSQNDESLRMVSNNGDPQGMSPRPERRRGMVSPNGYPQSLSPRPDGQWEGMVSHNGVGSDIHGLNGHVADSHGMHLLLPPQFPEYAHSEPGDRQDVGKLLDVVEEEELRPRSASHMDTSLRRTQSSQDLRSTPQGLGSRSHVNGLSSGGAAKCPYIPLQAGSSEEMAADFLLFCAAVKAAFVPPPPNNHHSHSAHKYPPGFPFPDFNPNWFRFLPGFPK